MRRSALSFSAVFVIAMLTHVRLNVSAASITMPHLQGVPHLPGFPEANPAVAPTVSPDVSPSPQPTPTASPAPFQMTHSIDVQFLHRQTSGTGTYTAEVPSFMSNGAPQPQTPFDLYSGAPLFPGTSLAAELRSTFRYTFKKSDIGLQTGVGYVDGSGYNAAYWSENSLPRLNSALGTTEFPTALSFPQHPGEDQITATDVEILSGDAGTADGKLRVKAGWFDLTQTDRFAFVQPPLTAVPPAIAIAPGESIASSLAGSDLWQPTASALPLHGLDLVTKQGLATLELANASLPGLSTAAVHTNIGSLVIDHGEGTRYSLNYSHTAIGGDPYPVGVAFGSQPQFQGSNNGLTAASMLSGQRQSLVGLRAAGHLYPQKKIDGIFEIGRSWYDADTSAATQEHRPGNYLHGGISIKNGRATTSLDLMRMDARYAPILLPYPSTANVWVPSYAANGNWYTSFYSLVDNTQIGPNRKSVGLHYNVDGGPFEFHAGITDLRQMEAYTTSSGLQLGFNEPGGPPPFRWTRS